jgi:hypothetical protein
MNSGLNSAGSETRQLIANDRPQSGSEVRRFAPADAGMTQIAIDESSHRQRPA